MSKYDDIKTAAELVAEVRAHGLSLDQEDICRAQDIFGNSPIEELYDALHDVESEYYEEQEEYLS